MEGGTRLIRLAPGMHGAMHGKKGSMEVPGRSHITTAGVTGWTTDDIPACQKHLARALTRSNTSDTASQ